MTDLRRYLAVSSAIALALGATVAHAQGRPPTPAAANDEIIVTGEAYAVGRAITAKRTLDVVADTISASEIGSIPVFGLGEALQRVPGVSFVINNGRGEAQFLTLRGLNPDYNSVTLDGIQLPSTEETRRQFSFDVIPSIIAKQVTVYKSYRADQPSDAIGGVTELRSHSAFDHPGLFAAGHLDFAYWTHRELFGKNPVSGQGDIRISKTFGPDDRFGVLILGSYYVRASNSLNSFSLPYSYYGYTGGAQTVTATTLTPTTSVAGLIPIPDRRRWFSYDNLRDRPGVFAKFEYRYAGVRAALSGGFFQHRNNEFRYSNYLNRGAATATFTSPTSATFATGQFESDFDKFEQYRNIRFIQGSIGVDLDDRTKIDATANYARGFYRQDTIETVFVTATTAAFASTYVGNVGGIALLQPVTPASFSTLSNYAQGYFLTNTDSSTTKQPQFRIDLIRTGDADGQGFGFGAGLIHRELRQSFYLTESRFNTNPAAGITLATLGALKGTLSPGDAGGLVLNFLNPEAAAAYLAANPGNYTVAASNVQRSTLNNFRLREIVDGIYAQASFRTGGLFAQAGVRYEWTKQAITNFQPNPIGSTTSFVAVDNRQRYNEPLPEVNVSYDLAPTLKLRLAVSRTLARARFSDLAQNQSLTLTGTIASLTIANPTLRPRTAWNYDASLEFYPVPGAVLSAALFAKDISNEIFTVTTTVQNTTLPGFVGNNYTLTTTQSLNAGSAKVRGVELGLNVASFGFVQHWLAGFGATANVAFMDYTTPRIQMSDLVTFRALPQLLESVKFVANAAVFYRRDAFSVEVAYNHTGKMPTSFDRTNAVADLWFKATNTVDAQIAYRFLPGVEFRIQGKNLTAETNQRVVGPTQNLSSSLLSNGPAYYAGVSFAL